MMTQKTVLTGEYPLILLPALAKELGVTAALMLQQIHYWLQKRVGRVIDGEIWVYNTYEQWQEQQFPFLHISTLKRAIAKLKRLGLVKIEQHDKSQWNHRNYYTIDHEGLKALQDSIGSKRLGGNGHFGHSDQCDLDKSSNTQITPENTSETTNTLAAANSNLEEEHDIKPTLRVKDEKKGIEQTSSAIQNDHSSDERLELVKKARIKLNSVLRKTVLGYSLEQVQQAIAHYSHVVAEQGARRKPGGWLTKCLRGQWWHNEEPAPVYQAKEQINPPSPEQMEQLELLKRKCDIVKQALRGSTPPQTLRAIMRQDWNDGWALVIDCGNGIVMPWWEVLVAPNA